MPLALVVAPSDPLAGDASARRESLAWLRGQLAARAFDVVIVSGGQDPQQAIEKAAPTINRGDTVLVHLSGRLVGADSLAFGGDKALNLAVLRAAFAACEPAALSFFGELAYDDEPGAPAVDERLAAVVDALSTDARRYGVLVALRPSALLAPRLAFTRAILAGTDPRSPADTLVLEMHRRAVRSPDARAAAPRFAFVGPDAESSEPTPLPSIAPPPVSVQTPRDALIAEATAAREWARVADLRLDRLETLSDPRTKVRELVAVARIFQAELGDADGAIAALEQAREIAPSRPSVLQALRRGYETLGRWEDAIEVIGALVEVTESAEDRAALLAAQVQLRARASQPGSGRPAPWVGPPEATSVATYQAAFETHEREGRAEEAFLAALALEELGAAEGRPQALVNHLRAVGPVRARAPLDASGWQDLRAVGFDDVLAELFAAVGAAAIRLKIEDLREARRLPALDRGQRLSETSTASAVRSFHWAARFLGIPCPDLYAIDDAPGIAVVHAAEPSTVLGPSVLSGVSAKDLAFRAGRHLTYYRPEYHAILYYPTREELTELLLAAVQLGLPDGAPSPAPARSLRVRLARRLSDEERAALLRAIRRLNERGGQAQIGAWMRSVELTAARAGLLLCGDLAAAAGVVRAESRPIADLSTDERRADLIAFCASEAHLRLRARFVATAPESIVPAGAPLAVRTLAAQ